MDFDFIIIGGGSAGLVVANRLTEDEKNSVLLLEAGGEDLSPFIRIPAGEVIAILSQKYNWHYPAEPDASRGGRVDLWPGGKVLGGGSSINGMMYVRGNRQDYDGWAQMGAKGWDYEGVLPYFNRAETNEDGGSKFRGGKGPLKVSHPRVKKLLTEEWIKGGVEIGINHNPDVNGEYQEGIGPVQATQNRGWRHSTARAYLAPIRKRNNLKVRTHAFVTKILFEGKRAIGVEYQKGGETLKVYSKKEIILSAGAIASPKILMLSGVGPKTELEKHNINPVHYLEGVGQNLQEHPGIMMCQHVNVPTLNTEIGPFKIIKHGLDFILRGRGPATTSIGHAAAFVKVNEGANSPELQITYSPIAYDIAETGITLYKKPAVGVAINVCRPQTKGQITLRSNNPEEKPKIEYELLGSSHDVKLLIEGCKISRRIFESKSFAPFSLGERIPGPDTNSDEDWEKFIRANAFLMFHPIGTCKMGEDPMAVVDSELKVHGLQELRVVDASIMPSLPSANTNAPAIMIGEKGSDLILNKKI